MSSFNTKYIFSGSPTSPSLGGRSAAARQRLSSKISAPRPMNLPSLKSEIGSGTGKTSTSPATTYTWGMSKDTSKENNTDKKPLNTTSKAAPTSPANSPTASTTTASLKQTEPAIATPVATSPPRAWGTVPKVSTAKVQTSSLDFPTAQEAAAFEKSKKNTLMVSFLLISCVSIK
ncbi:hypothetical protein BDF20DRAFT_307836 [Mycotypha africana]|uniref:uncharacterized protein n=1 Tax=Mycotypha africana TaxID=64632 RepID=UPI0023007108|nr:uncharacterized protein BDF20DRAFT_307836 [Mycotypha africana]KAI8988145.1 hypothetical protein BDF20DRAFT_307836 [Mycotypha africana]